MSNKLQEAILAGLVLKEGKTNAQIFSSILKSNANPGDTTLKAFELDQFDFDSSEDEDKFYKWCVRTGLLKKSGPLYVLTDKGYRF